MFHPGPDQRESLKDQPASFFSPINASCRLHPSVVHCVFVPGDDGSYEAWADADLAAHPPPSDPSCN